MHAARRGAAVRCIIMLASVDGRRLQSAPGRGVVPRAPARTRLVERRAQSLSSRRRANKVSSSPVDILPAKDASSRRLVK